MNSLKKKCLLLVMSINVGSLVIASEGPTNKPKGPRLGSKESLNVYMKELRSQLASGTLANTSEGNKEQTLQRQYVNASINQRPLGRGSSGNNKQETLPKQDASNNQQSFGRGSSGNNTMELQKALDEKKKELDKNAKL